MDTFLMILGVVAFCWIAMVATSLIGAAHLHDTDDGDKTEDGW